MNKPSFGQPIVQTSDEGGAVAINFIIDGGGAEIGLGVQGFIEMPFGMTIESWRLLGDQNGSIVIDVWKDTFANYPPTVADSIAGTEKPTLAAADSAEDTSLSTWDTSMLAGDIIGFNVDSVTTIQRVTVSLRGAKT